MKNLLKSKAAYCTSANTFRRNYSFVKLTLGGIQQLRGQEEGEGGVSQKSTIVHPEQDRLTIIKFFSTLFAVIRPCQITIFISNLDLGHLNTAYYLKSA